MRLTTPPLTNDNINFKEHDALNRELFGQSLLELITRVQEELVICLDAQWGEGKTTFVKMWQNLLNENEIKSIYFDAFANDYIDDTFIALASHIVTFVEEELHKNNPARKKLDNFKEKASKVGVQLLSWGAKIGIKAATLGVIKESDLEGLSEIKSDISNGTSNLASKFIEDRISSHKYEIDTITTFKTTLEQIAKDINVKPKKPLVIIIDELDRCKPTYAVEIIEKIKHVFSVKNIVFLLVMNRQQLEGAIKSVYGVDIDAASYLQKFINVNCFLPKNRDDDIANDYKKYCIKLFKLHELNEIPDQNTLMEYISSLAKHFDLSLRQLEKSFTNISIFYAVNPKGLNLPQLIALLAIVRVSNHNVYSRLKNNKISFAELQKELQFPESFSKDNENWELKQIFEWIQYCVFSEEEYNTASNKKDFNQIEEMLWKFHIKRREIIPLFCNFFDMFKTK